MLKSDNIYFIILLLMVLATAASAVFIQFLDEFIVMLMCMFVSLDIVINRNWKKYKLLYLMVGIMLFYAAMSIYKYHFNTTHAVIYDFVLQLKPLVPLAICYAANPVLNVKQKQIIRILCVIISVFAVLVSLVGMVIPIFGHISLVGNTTFTLFAIYLYCSIDKNGKVSRQKLATAFFIIAIGLVCTRSKYYGEFAAVAFMLFFYKPGMFKELKMSYILSFLVVLIIAFIAIYPKLEYYFLQNIGDELSTGEALNMARPALYYGMFMILMDYPWFGTGLASFAVYASSPSVHYSSLYSNYYLDKVWGLSEEMPDFICDAFYPELAQFGFVGLALFIYLFYWIYKRLKVVNRKGNKYGFIIGVLCIIFILIESTTNTTFTKSYGETIMFLMGMIIAPTRTMTSEEINNVLKQPITT